ncbi:MAG TPA: alpha/beta hydrolase [Candidatus Limnocylindrales bacterium]|jgi:pimeloyl-ACP methyl ester carboxylesterase|nr:alpha/beta hydrolase [Candidatus Limnocylindrales bacterium]
MATGIEEGRTGDGLAWDARGDGEPVVFIHAGVADRRMWEPQWTAFAGAFRAIRYDARGFGETLPPGGPWAHHDDLAALLDELALERVHLVGASLGAGIAVELALARPSTVASLVLVAPGGALIGEPPDVLRSVWRAEGEALDRGDLDEAVEINLHAWVDGPARSPEAVEPEIRSFVGRMQRHAFELPGWDADVAPESELDPSAADRLDELRIPVLVVVGMADWPPILEVAERIGREVPAARVVRWAGVAHLPSLERPTEFERLVREFVLAAGAGALPAG